MSNDIGLTRVGTFYLHSTDPSDPNSRLTVECDIPNSGLVSILDCDMTSNSESAQIIADEYLQRIVFTPEQARWLRDVLNKLDLRD